MFKTLRGAWSIPELRKKLLFTVIILLIYRVCNAIPVPFVDTDLMKEYFNSNLQNSILGFYNMMNGSAFAQAKLLALGIQPYINASIIVQLLTVAIPALERMAKEEGEEGKKKINNITRYVTVALGVILGIGYYTMIKNAPNTYGVAILMTTAVPEWLVAVVIVGAFTAGSCFVMWMGEQITEHGVSNGISLILFANIIAGFPDMVGSLYTGMTDGITLVKDEPAVLIQWWQLLIIGVVAVLLVLFIVFINDAERRIPIQYAKRVVGRKVYGGQNTNLPIKVAMSGVMPVIFAQSICSLPTTVCSFVPGWKDSVINKFWLGTNTWPYLVVYGVMIFFFSWFYAQIQYDPVEIGNNLKKNGGFIPGFRPGKPTADFIKKVIGKIIIFGSVYLAIVSMIPMIFTNIWPEMQVLAIGGTSIIIMVGVALETVKAIEAQMLMRHYKGFLD